MPCISDNGAVVLVVVVGVVVVQAAALAPVSPSGTVDGGDGTEAARGVDASLVGHCTSWVHCLVVCFTVFGKQLCSINTGTCWKEGALSLPPFPILSAVPTVFGKDRPCISDHGVVVVVVVGGLVVVVAAVLALVSPSGTSDGGDVTGNA